MESTRASTRRVHVRAAGRADAVAWERLREALWPSAPGEHRREIAERLDGARDSPAEVLLAFDEDGTPIGLAELDIRPYAEGCDSGRVAYLEGWYVEPGRRRQGVGAALIEEAVRWARRRGCTEMASDTTLHNATSEAAHRAAGFTETARLICFRRPL